jgi:hypothetical protein
MDSSMTTYMLIKAGLVVFAAFCWGIYCGLNGRSLGGGRHDSQQDQTRD